MTLGEFREETKNLDDSYILDCVQFVEALPGYYDGYAHQCGSKNIYTSTYLCKPKLRFMIKDNKTLFWDVCEDNKTIEENWEIYKGYFNVDSETVSESRAEEYWKFVRQQFDEFYRDPEWVSYIHNDKHTAEL